MARRRCESCGRESERTFELKAAGVVHVFDSLDCATRALGRSCEGCGIRVIGLGLIQDGHFYCSSRCASAAGRRHPEAIDTLQGG